jgi:hypothetical protein
MRLTKKLVLEKLRAEIAKANAEHDRCIEVFKNPYAGLTNFIDMKEAFARAGGIAKCMEIVEAMDESPLT